ERVLALDGRDRMDRVGLSDRLRSRLAEAEEAHLAGLDELAHRANGFLDRGLRIDAVLVIEVDVVDAEPAERAIAGLLHVLGPPADRPLHRVLGVAHDPELRRERDLVAA